jgi:hypothetical protein
MLARVRYLGCWASGLANTRIVMRLEGPVRWACPAVTLTSRALLFTTSVPGLVRANWAQLCERCSVRARHLFNLTLSKRRGREKLTLATLRKLTLCAAKTSG